MSFRLGRHDGVSVVAATWARVLGELGWTVRTVAGDGPVDHLLPGLAVGAAHAADRVPSSTPRSAVSTSWWWRTSARSR